MTVLRSRSLAVVVLLAGLFTYPVVVLARSSPQFPSAHDCVVPATSDGNLQLVFGRFVSAQQAGATAARASEAGFHVTVVLDDCGRLVVATPGLTTLASAQAAAARAAKAGLTARPEVAPSP